MPLYGEEAGRRFLFRVHVTTLWIWLFQYEICASCCEPNINLICKVYKHRDAHTPFDERFDWLTPTGESPHIPARLDLRVMIAPVRIQRESFRVWGKISP